MYSFLYGLNFSCGVRQPEFPVELQFYSFDFSLSIVYLLILTRPSPTTDVVSLLSPYFGMGGARCCLGKFKQSLEVVDRGGHIGLFHRGPPDVSAGRGHLQT